MQFPLWKQRYTQRSLYKEVKKIFLCFSLHFYFLLMVSISIHLLKMDINVELCFALKCDGDLVVFSGNHGAVCLA